MCGACGTIAPRGDWYGVGAAVPGEPAGRGMLLLAAAADRLYAPLGVRARSVPASRGIALRTPVGREAVAGSFNEIGPAVTRLRGATFDPLDLDDRTELG